MDVKVDIKNSARRLESRLETLRKDKTVLPVNKKTIVEFDSYLGSIGIGNLRRLKYLHALSWLSRSVKKSFSKITKEDLVALVGKVEASNLRQWTKVDRRITVKRFFKWFRGNDEEYPPEVKWMKCHMKERLVKMPEELLSEEDIKNLADACAKPRDKAFIQILYESGCRSSELLTVQLKNVEFDEYGAVMRVTGKTGDRRVRIIASSPALATWMDFHPFKDDSQAYLWSKNKCLKYNDRTPFSPSYARKLLQEAAKAAGIKKRIYPHLFRHSRATNLANKLTEAQMKEYFGWVQGSNMASVYVHLSGRDVDNAILEINGLRKSEEGKMEKFNLVFCDRCDKQNSPGSKFCTHCGYGLDKDAQNQPAPQKSNELLKQLMKDSEFREIMMKKIVEMSL